MIQEQYVSFETAKILKEKLFDWECHAFYTGDGKMFYYQHYHDFDRKDIIEAPTQQMTMRWLREVHNIDIVIFHEQLPTDCYWAMIERYLYTEFQQNPDYSTYEKSCEDAIIYCLKNLI